MDVMQMRKLSFLAAVAVDDRDRQQLKTKKQREHFTPVRAKLMSLLWENPGLTEEQLGERLGVTDRTIRNWRTEIEAEIGRLELAHFTDAKALTAWVTEENKRFIIMTVIAGRVFPYAQAGGMPKGELDNMYRLMEGYGADGGDVAWQKLIDVCSSITLPGGANMIDTLRNYFTAKRREYLAQKS
jgi:hypothetical protein